MVAPVRLHLGEAESDARTSPRPTDPAHEYIFLLAKSPRYFYDAQAVRDPTGRARYGDFGVICRTRRTTRLPFQASRRGLPQFPMLANTDPSGRNLRSVWQIAPQPYPGAGFATFPEALPEICIRAGTSERGACAECGRPWAEGERRGGGRDRSRLAPRQVPGIRPGAGNRSTTASTTGPIEEWT